MKPQPLFFSALSALIVLASCSDSSDSPNTDPATLSHKLKAVESAAEFERQYKDALIEYFNTQDYYGGPYPTDDVAFEESDGAAPTNSADADGSVSQTNVQESGVDEADRIKTDGNTLFVLSKPSYYYYGIPEADVAQETSMPAPHNEADEYNQLRVYSLDADNATSELVTDYDLPLEDSLVADGLYWYRDGAPSKLIVTANGTGYYEPVWYESYSWGGFRGALVGLDVSNPSAPKSTENVEFDGNILSTRRIGEHLIVASRYFPTIEGINYYPQTDAEKDRNKSIIESLDINDLLPSYTASGSDTETLLTAPESCFVPESADSQGYSPDVITLVSYDLSDMSIASSLCFVGATETFYASTDKVFLATTRYDWALDNDGMAEYADQDVETDIHGFSFANGTLSYDASGVVKGQLGWNIDQRPFRLSARDGDLRVVSFTGELEADKSPVRLTVLRERGAELTTLATLPSDQRPEPLGKPGEQLYASRFIGDRAFFVTFRATDPLYIVDLSTSDDPRVVGELFIDGYSDYLHPISETLLLGLGKDAIPDERAEEEERGAWYQGVKLSLIDITDPTNPAEVDKHVIGRRGTESPALRSHHAFTFLNADNATGSSRVAIPVSIHDVASPYTDSSKPWAWYDWSRSGLQLLEVDTASQQIVDKGLVKVADRETSESYWISTEFDRSVLASDAVYYVNNNRVYSTFWQTPENVEGPK